MNVHESGLSADMVPDTTVDVREAFHLEQDIQVPAFTRKTDYVPNIDDDYRFDPDTTLAILAGFAHNRRVMIQGYHGTGKSTHIEQVAARLNWPCIRVNLDSHISRIDLVGKDAIVLEEGMQVTAFKEGILPWALQHPSCIVFDEYDAGRPDVMFVIQASSRSRRETDFAGPKPRDHSAPMVPLVLNDQHSRAWRHYWSLSRYSADQPRADGSLEHRGDAELLASRRRSRHRLRQDQYVEEP